MVNGTSQDPGDKLLEGQNLEGARDDRFPFFQSFLPSQIAGSLDCDYQCTLYKELEII